MSIYGFEMKDAAGEMIDFSQYQGKVLLIVNTATKCGFTPQYDGLEALYEDLNIQGFEVLDFPCNQFANQAPEASGEIQNFCQDRFGVTFKVFDKIDVNGANEAPLYAYLKAHAGEGGNASKFTAAVTKIKDKVIGRNIKWNFTKFLVDRNGNVVQRYAPNVRPQNIENDIKALL